MLLIACGGTSNGVGGGGGGDDGGGGGGSGAPDAQSPTADAVGGPADADGVDGTSNTPTDASSTGGDGAVVTCDDMVCDPNQECCVSSNNGHRCVAPGTCSDAVFVCDGPFDCPGNDVCCAHTTGNENTNYCMPQSECQGNGGGGLQQGCYSDADCAFLPNQPKCCDAPSTWGKICRANCGH